MFIALDDFVEKEGDLTLETLAKILFACCAIFVIAGIIFLIVQ